MRIICERTVRFEYGFEDGNLDESLKGLVMVDPNNEESYVLVFGVTLQCS